MRIGKKIHVMFPEYILKVKQHESLTTKKKPIGSLSLSLVFLYIYVTSLFVYPYVYFVVCVLYKL